MRPMGNSISSELMSAMSALNTEVTYTGPDKDKDGEWVFISAAEPLAAHSIEHIQSAYGIASDDIRDDISEIRKFTHNLEGIKGNIDNWEKLDTLLRNIERRL